MKKTFLLICLAAGLLACSKEPVQQEETIAGAPMTFEINVADTKAFKANWAAGDEVYVFFNGLGGKYLTLTCEADGSWTNTPVGELTDTDFANLTTQTLTAVHFPVPVSVDFANGKFSFTSGGKPVYTYYFFQTGKAYAINGTTITASLSLHKPAGFMMVQVPGIQANVDDYTFGCSLVEPVACASVSTDGTIAEKVLEPGARLSGFADEDSGIFAGRLTSPGTEEDYTFTLATAENIYTLTRDEKALLSGSSYSFPVPTSQGDGNWTATDVSDLYVDMGLSVYWAKCNLSNDINEFINSEPSASGDYYAWGHTRGENAIGKKYSWNNYNTSNTTFCASHYDSSMDLYVLDNIFLYCNDAAYGTADGRLVLDQSEHDAAHVLLGGSWHMPTFADLLDLMNDTYCDWSVEALNGVDGYKVTSKITGESIFLPTQVYSDDLILDWNHPDPMGLYWSSNVGDGNPDYYGPSPAAAYAMVFDITMQPTYDIPNRFCRFSIRPVCDK